MSSKRPTLGRSLGSLMEEVADTHPLPKSAQPGIGPGPDLSVYAPAVVPVATPALELAPAPIPVPVTSRSSDLALFPDWAPETRVPARPRTRTPRAERSAPKSDPFPSSGEQIELLKMIEERFEASKKKTSGSLPLSSLETLSVPRPVVLSSPSLASPEPPVDAIPVAPDGMDTFVSDQEGRVEFVALSSAVSEPEPGADAIPNAPGGMDTFVPDQEGTVEFIASPPAVSDPEPVLMDETVAVQSESAQAAAQADAADTFVPDREGSVMCEVLFASEHEVPVETSGMRPTDLPSPELEAVEPPQEVKDSGEIRAPEDADIPDSKPTVAAPVGIRRLHTQGFELGPLFSSNIMGRPRKMPALKRKWLWMALAIVGLLAVGGGILFFAVFRAPSASTSSVMPSNNPVSPADRVVGKPLLVSKLDVLPAPTVPPVRSASPVLPRPPAAVEPASPDHPAQPPWVSGLEKPFVSAPEPVAAPKLLTETWAVAGVRISALPPAGTFRLVFDKPLFTRKTEWAPGMKALLKKTSETLMAQPGHVGITVVGHSDSEATPNAQRNNARIELSRAEQVRDYLVRECGWTLENVAAVASGGLGLTAPFPNTPEEKLKNRTVILDVAIKVK